MDNSASKTAKTAAVKRAKTARSGTESPENGEIGAGEAAKRLAMTAQAVGLWCSRPGAPVRRVGARVFVRWPDFMRWREDQLVRTAVEDATKKLRAQLDAATGNAEGGDPGRRLLMANARKAEIEVAELDGRKVDVTAALAVIEKLCTDLRAGLIPFPRTAAPKLLGAKSLQELESRLDTEVHRLMEVLAQPVELGNPEQEMAA